MSTLKVDNIRHNSATSDAITMASDGTCTAKLTSVGGGGLSHQTRPGGGGHLPAQGETHHPHTQPGASGGRYRHLHDASSLHFS